MSNLNKRKNDNSKFQFKRLHLNFNSFSSIFSIPEICSKEGLTVWLSIRLNQEILEEKFCATVFHHFGRSEIWNFNWIRLIWKIIELLNKLRLGMWKVNGILLQLLYYFYKVPCNPNERDLPFHEKMKFGLNFRLIFEAEKISGTNLFCRCISDNLTKFL